MTFRPSMLVLIAALSTLATRVGAQESPLCEPARGFLVDGFGMKAMTEADSIADPRTTLLLPGCRIVAVGGTSFTLGETADLLWDQLTAEGWSHTPDPLDIPARGARRLRKGGVDCLFAVYTAVTETIGTDAQLRLNRSFVPYGQDQKFNVQVQCVPALEIGPTRDPVTVSSPDPR